MAVCTNEYGQSWKNPMARLSSKLLAITLAFGFAWTTRNSAAGAGAQVEAGAEVEVKADSGAAHESGTDERDTHDAERLAPGNSAADSVARPRLSELLDQHLRAKWQAEAFEPQWCDDATFLRRATLDLTGVLPTPPEVRGFLSDTNPDKRRELIDRLLASPLFARHLANRWTQILLESRLSPQAPELTQWLAERFGRNLRYDRFVADLLAATGRADAGPLVYFQANEFKPEKLASSSARLFLGMRLGCAECHNHPYDKWTQEDFWGYAAFFAQVAARNEMAVERIELIDRLDGEVKMPNTELVVLPRYPDGEDADRRDFGTRRQWLALWMASPENVFLGRAAVNRVWQHLFGRGLVHPVDDMSPQNGGLDPELLNLLSREFVASGYDLRELYRAIAQSQLYQLSSQHDETGEAFNPFHAMPVRPLTAEQIFDSLERNLLALAPDTAPNAGSDARAPQLASNTSQLRLEFVEQMRAVSGEDGSYRAGVQQALSLMNGPLTAQATSPTGRLLQALQAPFFTAEQQIELTYLATLSRPPRAAELARLAELRGSGGPSQLPVEAMSDLLWALLNSSEFLFCH